MGADHKKLARYMFNYLAMMMAISSIFLVIDGPARGAGQKDPAVGVPAHRGLRPLPQDEVPGGLRLHQLPRLPGQKAVRPAVPALARKIYNSTEERLPLPFSALGPSVPGAFLSRLFVLWASLALDFHGQNLHT